MHHGNIPIDTLPTFTNYRPNAPGLGAPVDHSSFPELTQVHSYESLESLESFQNGHYNQDLYTGRQDAQTDYGSSISRTVVPSERAVKKQKRKRDEGSSIGHDVPTFAPTSSQESDSSTFNSRGVNDHAIVVCSIWLDANPPGEVPTEEQLHSLANFMKCTIPLADLMIWFKLESQRRLLSGHTVAPRPVPQVEQAPIPVAHNTYRKCFPTGTPNTHRDPEKPYCCTHGCSKTFARKGDWKRHEEINIPQILWQCKICPAKLWRKDKFRDHMKEKHPHVEATKQYISNASVALGQGFVERCGFCGHTCHEWVNWINHVAAHFEDKLPDGPWVMSRWKRPWVDDEEMDNGDDDDDDNDDDDDDDQDFGDSDNDKTDQDNTDDTSDSTGDRNDDSFDSSKNPGDSFDFGNNWDLDSSFFAHNPQSGGSSGYTANQIQNSKRRGRDRRFDVSTLQSDTSTTAPQQPILVSQRASQPMQSIPLSQSKPQPSPSRGPKPKTKSKMGKVVTLAMTVYSIIGKWRARTVEHRPHSHAHYGGLGGLQSHPVYDPSSYQAHQPELSHILESLSKTHHDVSYQEIQENSIFTFEPERDDSHPRGLSSDMHGGSTGIIPRRRSRLMPPASLQDYLTKAQQKQLQIESGPRQRNEDEHIPVVIDGLGGRGKSQLALPRELLRNIHPHLAKHPRPSEYIIGKALPSHRGPYHDGWQVEQDTSSAANYSQKRQRRDIFDKPSINVPDIFVCPFTMFQDQKRLERKVEKSHRVSNACIGYGAQEESFSDMQYLERQQTHCTRTRDEMTPPRRERQTITLESHRRRGSNVVRSENQSVEQTPCRTCWISQRERQQNQLRKFFKVGKVFSVLWKETFTRTETQSLDYCDRIQTFDEWVASGSNPSHLWLQGLPGSGKALLCRDGIIYRNRRAQCHNCDSKAERWRLKSQQTIFATCLANSVYIRRATPTFQEEFQRQVEDRWVGYDDQIHRWPASDNKNLRDRISLLSSTPEGWPPHPVDMILALLFSDAVITHHQKREKSQQDERSHQKPSDELTGLYTMWPRIYDALNCGSELQSKLAAILLILSRECCLSWFSRRWVSQEIFLNLRRQTNPNHLRQYPSMNIVAVLISDALTSNPCDRNIALDTNTSALMSVATLKWLHSLLPLKIALSPREHPRYFPKTPPLPHGFNLIAQSTQTHRHFSLGMYVTEYDALEDFILGGPWSCRRRSEGLERTVGEIMEFVGDAE